MPAHDGRYKTIFESNTSLGANISRLPPPPRVVITAFRESRRPILPPLLLLLLRNRFKFNRVKNRFGLRRGVALPSAGLVAASPVKRRHTTSP